MTEFATLSTWIRWPSSQTVVRRRIERCGETVDYSPGIFLHFRLLLRSTPQLKWIRGVWSTEYKGEKRDRTWSSKGENEYTRLVLTRTLHSTETLYSIPVTGFVERDVITRVTPVEYVRSIWGRAK